MILLLCVWNMIFVEPNRDRRNFPKKHGASMNSFRKLNRTIQNFKNKSCLVCVFVDIERKDKN